MRASGGSRGRWSARPSARANSALVTGRGAVTFTRAGDRRRRQRPDHELDPVLAVDPRPVLAAGTHRAADAEPEGQQHPRERAAAALEREARAQVHDTRADRRARGLGLPSRAEIREEVRPTPVRLGHDLVAARAVVADRGRAGEHEGRVVDGEDGVGEAARGVEAAGDERGLPRVGPALGNHFARQVHDRVGAVDFLRPGAGLRRGRVPRDGAALRRARAARQHHDLGAAHRQGGGRAAARGTRSRRQ